LDKDNKDYQMDLRNTRWIHHIVWHVVELAQVIHPESEHNTQLALAIVPATNLVVVLLAELLFKKYPFDVSHVWHIVRLLQLRQPVIVQV
jgi:hypothetical protein